MLQVIEAEETGNSLMADVIAPVGKRVEPGKSETFFAVGQKWIEILYDGKLPEQVSLYGPVVVPKYVGDRTIEYQ